MAVWRDPRSSFRNTYFGASIILNANCGNFVK